MRVVCPAPRMKALLHRKERMHDREDLRALRQELRSVHSIRLNAKQISEQLCSRVQAEIEALCATRIHEIEADLKRLLQSEAFGAARLNWIDAELNRSLVGRTPQPLAQQWP